MNCICPSRSVYGSWLPVPLAALLLAGQVGVQTAYADATDSEFITDYRRWLDDGRTPARLVDMVRASPGWTHIDHLADQPRPLPAGSRVLFTDRGRSAIMVVVGSEPLSRAGFRMIASHIDTPTPRLDLSGLRAGDGKAPLTATAHGYGSIRHHQWQYLPLALVGRVALSGDREVAIALGLDESDEFAFYATSIDRNRGALTITLASIPEKSEASAVAANEASARRDAGWLFAELERRFGVVRTDLATAELYLVPRQRARDVGLDRALIGAHGQDDRANSYIAWRATRELPASVRQTVVTWLVDREEEGSHYPAGATSQFLEAVIAFLARTQGQPATEALLGRVFSNSIAISADTPAMLNPNWPEVHEDQHAPIIGRGVVVFPHTGRDGKGGGNQAHAPLVRDVVDTFARAGQPLQFGLLGRVDEGGGGTIAKYLANRGIDVVDVGVAGISLHSPMEIFAKDDLLGAYRGFKVWLAGQ